MNRRMLLRGAAGVALLWSALRGEREAFAAPSEALYEKCAKACEECYKACLTCNKHCEGMVKGGVKSHITSARLSADCRDICALAAKLCARKGPMAVALCGACLKACEACGAECGKYSDMSVMVACAKSCAVCAKVCREMIVA